jgi:tetratricopeptide (TPR) repeat protein
VAQAAGETAEGVTKLVQPETVVTTSPAGAAGTGWDWSGKPDPAIQPAAVPTVAPVSKQVAQTGDTVDGVAPAAVPTQHTVAQPASAAEAPQLRPAIGADGAPAASVVAPAAASIAPAAVDQPLGSAPVGANGAPAAPEATATGGKASVKLYNSAVKNHLAGKLPEAISDYKGAIAANPQLAEAHSNLGLIYNQQHDYPQALTEFRKALAINPKDAITYNGIGAALRAERDLPGAIKNWQTAVTLDMHLATAHYNLGTAYEIQKDYDRALDSYKEAVKNDYRLGEAYYRMGLILVKKQQNAEALAQFREALKVSTDSEYSDDARSKIAMLSKTAPAAK